MNFAPRLSTCSLAAGRTSVAVTMAPSRRAVAIACRPATPAPMTNTLAAGTVPAAVIIIGRARPYSAAAVDHGAIAGEIGLRGQHVHGLRPGDARHQLHGKGRDARLGHGGERRLIAERIHDGDDQRTRLVGGEFSPSVGPAHLEHHIGVVDGVGGDRRRRPPHNPRHGCRIRCRRRARSPLGAQRLHLLDGFGGCGDPRLGGISSRATEMRIHAVSMQTGRVGVPVRSAVGVEQQRQRRERQHDEARDARSVQTLMAAAIDGRDDDGARRAASGRSRRLPPARTGY